MTDANGANHYIGKLHVQCGEYSFTETFLFTLADQRTEPVTFLNRIAGDWYGGKSKKDDGGYYFNGGAVFVQPANFNQISADVYSTLRGIFADLTNH